MMTAKEANQKKRDNDWVVKRKREDDLKTKVPKSIDKIIEKIEGGNMREAIEKMREDVKKIRKTAEYLSELDSRFGILSYNTVTNLKLLKESLEKKIEEKIDNCDHDFRYDGHGHKDDYYTCTLCGKTEER